MDDIVGYTCYGLPAVFNPQWARNMKNTTGILIFPHFFWTSRREGGLKLEPNYI